METQTSTQVEASKTNAKDWKGVWLKPAPVSFLSFMLWFGAGAMAGASMLAAQEPAGWVLAGLLLLPCFGLVVAVAYSLRADKKRGA